MNSRAQGERQTVDRVSHDPAGYRWSRMPALGWLVLIALLGLLPACGGRANPPISRVDKAALQAALDSLNATSTPFRPSAPTPWQQSPPQQALDVPLAPTLIPTEFPQAGLPNQPVPVRVVPILLEPSLDFYGIDFSSRQKVTIMIYPPDKKVNRGKPIRLSFIPAENCRFGTKKACVYAYKPSVSGNVIILTVHSGVGGQAQSFRHALEGTGINRAGLELEAVQRNLKNLAGAEVVIEQGGRKVSQRMVDGLARIPARALGRYFKAPLAEILEIAANQTPHATAWVIPQAPILVIETCGWKMNGEAGAQNVSDTTGSIYLAVIR